MRADQPSRTAWRSALRRAAHQLWDSPRVYDDPLALKLVGAEEEAGLRAKSARSVTQLEQTIRASMAARSRFARDCLDEAVARGVRQIVVMGAGLDTTVLQDVYKDLRGFEIDHPATQSWKKQVLADAGIATPANLTFVPVDFTKQALAGELPRAGWDANTPTFFSWLGVTPYLPPSAVAETLRFIAARPAGSEIAFDVSTPPGAVTLYERLARIAYGLKNAIRGETVGTRFDPAQLAAEMRAMGYRDVAFLAGGDVNARYFAGRADGLKVSNRSALIRGIV